MDSPGDTLVEIRNLWAGYESKPVLKNISIRVNAGDVVALIGPNGAGKSTVLKILYGLLPAWAGSVYVKGMEVHSHSPAKALAAGMTYAPQANRVFPALTVKENLILGERKSLPRSDAQLDAVLEDLPALVPLLHRAAGNLSGGEQQMVNLGRSLIGQPQLILLDEPSLGLSAQMNEELLSIIGRLTERGITVIIVEQKIKLVLRIAKRVVGMKLGLVKFDFPASELQERSVVLSDLFLG